MSRNNLRTRLNYMGGINQQDRMNKGKLGSLKRALSYSYQAATAILSDGREFRCLINPNKLSVDLDNKILSIPFSDICLNTGEISETGVKEGDIIQWKENGSHWLIYLKRLEETAYFRADIRRCHYEVTLENGSRYWAYVKGPAEQDASWRQVNGNYFNELNYSLLMLVTKNEETLNYFSRFKKIVIDGNPWEVQAVDSISTPGILKVGLKETFSNPIETDLESVVQKSQNEVNEQSKDTVKPYIFGLDNVYPYDTVQYQLKNHEGGGRWVVSNETRKNMVKPTVENNDFIELQILTGKSGKFTLSYIKDDKTITELIITVSSL